MRFIENGPSIPDELLNARDRGRVVFFCGAGVSRARAGLPDFFGLAEAVIRELGVPEDSDACKVLDKAREIGDELSVTGLISADRVFGLLEREFTVADIQAAVAKSLAPKEGARPVGASTPPSFGQDPRIEDAACYHELRSIV